MKIRFAPPAMPKQGVLVLLVAEGGTLPAAAEKLAEAGKGSLRRAIAKASFPTDFCSMASANPRS
jgi:hypothetical protein